MPWFKVDDTLTWNSKVVLAGNSAIGLWTRAGAWSMQQLTDGYVPEDIAKTLGTAADIRRLVSSGMWAVEGTGYRFHDWLERQPSRAKVLTDRDEAKERQKKARAAAKTRRDKSNLEEANGNVHHLSQR